MAIQFGVTIFLGAFIGQYLDKRIGNSQPFFTVALAVLATFISMYLVIKDLIKDSE